MARRNRNRRQTQSEDTLVDVVEVKDQAQGFLEANQSKLMGGLLLFVLLIGGIFAYKNIYKGPREKDATEQMTQAQYQFERDSFALALTNPGGGFSGFVDIIKDYSGTAAANLAHYYAGVSHLHLGQYDAALDYLNDFSPAGNITGIMKYGVMGDVYSEKNDLDQAMNYYQKAANAGNNDLLTSYYLKKIGLLHEKNGNFQDSKASYEKIKTEFPTSPEGRDIEKYISRVAARL